MTVNGSRIGLIIDTLVAKLQLSAAFADPARVYDGPATRDTMWTTAVFVGFDGEWEMTETYISADAATITQQFAYLGNTSMFEELDIQCMAQAWNGDPNLKVVRDQALTMFHGVETTLRTDPTLGIDGSVIAGINIAGTLRYRYDNGGNVLCRIPFTVHVKTTLLTV